MRALQVDRLQRRRTGAKVSAQARPSQWDSIRLVISWKSLSVRASRQFG